MCLGILVHSIFALVINTYYTGKLLNLGLILQLKDLFPSLMYSSVMGVVIIVVINSLSLSNFSNLVLGITIGVVSYSLVSYIFKAQELFYLKNIISTYFGKSNINMQRIKE